MTRASRPSFLRELPVDSTRTFAEVGRPRPPPTRLSRQPPPGTYPEAAGVLQRLGRRSGNRCPALEGSQAFSRFCGKEARSELAYSFVNHRYGYPDVLWGSTPISTFMSARTSVSVGPLCH